MSPYTPLPLSLPRKLNREEEKKKMKMMMNDGSGSEVDLREVEEEEEELELGLSLGANNRKYSCGRILTAKDLPSALVGSRDSPMSSSSSSSSSSGIKRAPPSSQVVVGWPPIRAFRMNSLVSHSKDNVSDTDTGNPDAKINDGAVKNREKKRTGSRFVKVNMDGDPIGRKVDLGVHASYETLALALELMFRKPNAAVKSFMHCTKASKLLDGSSEFALTYEDKEGDWMLVGDVPWGMFLDTVRRLRIMRTSDAGGLSPRFQPSTGVK